MEIHSPDASTGHGTRRHAAYEEAERAAHAGDAAATAMIDAMLRAATMPRERAELFRLRARVLWWDDPVAASQLLLTEAQPVRDSDPALAAAMLVDAANVAVAGGDIDAGLVAARSAQLVAGSDPASRAAADIALGMCLLLRDSPATGEELVRNVLERGHFHFAEAQGALPNAVAALYWIEEYDLAAKLLDRMIDEARHSSSPALAQWLDTRAAIDFRNGRWAAARGRSRESLRLAQERGQRVHESSAHSTLARIDAATGREIACRRHAERALELAHGNDLLFGWAISALGLLELGLGRLEAAVQQLEKLRGLGSIRVRTDPSIVNALVDLVEAHVRLGRLDQAREVLEGFEAEALSSGRTWAIAAAHRCLGLLSAPADARDRFGWALLHHDERSVPFERARTQLCLGELLRRGRRRAEARVHLQAALGTFEQLGALPWTERARRELAATQGRPSSSRTLPADALTGHELQVASRVAEGQTNREIAAALFVSERTVEYHLTNIYAKLGVRNRTQLARRIS